MDMEILIDLAKLYDVGGQSGQSPAKLEQLESYVRQARRQAAPGQDVVLTGQAPIWLYLKIAHALHGTARRLYYQSPVAGKVLIFDHDPF